MSQFSLLCAAAQTVLRNPLAYDWTIQGLGMLRLYLSDNVRMHIWHGSAIVAGISELHTHPWNFKSTVLTGTITDHLYRESNEDGIDFETHYKQKIFCGEDGCLIGEPSTVDLRKYDAHAYQAGESYRRQAADVHRSTFDDGTVTLVDRKFFEDVDHAYAYWNIGDKRGDARPRAATPDEIRLITDSALERFNGN